MTTQLIKIIQHGHWNTVIDKLNDGYRVTSSSHLSSIVPQTFCETLDQAKQIAVTHINEVKRQV